MKTKLLGGAVLLMTTFMSSQAMAEDADVSFTGLILESCTLAVANDGLLGVSPDHTVLSSKETGGLAGNVTAIANGIAATIEVIAPTVFNAGPPSADTDTTFDATYSLTGATTLSEVLGTNVTPLGLGATIVTVDASATKTSGTFDAGVYEMVPTVRCSVP